MANSGVHTDCNHAWMDGCNNLTQAIESDYEVFVFSMKSVYDRISLRSLMFTESCLKCVFGI